MVEQSSPVPRDDRFRIAVLTADRLLADSLLAMLAAEGLAGSRITARSGSRGRVLDVLVVESHGLDDASWRGVEELLRDDPLLELVVVASEPSVHDAVETVRSGAYTVLQYPVSGEELSAAVIAAGRRKRRAAQRLSQIGV